VQIPVYSLNGEVVEQIELNQAIFALPFNEAVVHQAMVRQLANSRQGTRRGSFWSQATHL